MTKKFHGIPNDLAFDFFQGKTAELYLNKFCNGSKGKSIIFKGQWMTPDQYEKVKFEPKF